MMCLANILNTWTQLHLAYCFALQKLSKILKDFKNNGKEVFSVCESIIIFSETQLDSIQPVEGISVVKDWVFLKMFISLILRL